MFVCLFVFSLQYTHHRLSRFFHYSVAEARDLGLDNKFRVYILSNGTVTWALAFQLETHCVVDLRYFPFDEQTCYIQFISWAYATSFLTFAVEGSDLVLDTYEENGEWDLVSANQSTYSTEVSTKPGGNMTLLRMTVTLRRVPTFFVLNIVVPSVLITVLSLLVYWLPYKSGEKISFAVTILLSFTVVLLMMSDVTPRNGNKMPLISKSLLLTAVLFCFTN